MLLNKILKSMIKQYNIYVISKISNKVFKIVFFIDRLLHKIPYIFLIYIFSITRWSCFTLENKFELSILVCLIYCGQNGQKKIFSKSKGGGS